MTPTTAMPRLRVAGNRLTAPPQSLADGALGHVLADIELALAGELPWVYVVAALDELGQAEPDVSPAAGLFHGAPAIAFVMDAATANGYFHSPERQRGLDLLLEDLVRRRLATAHARQRAAGPLTTDEYGLQHGLLGLGVVLLRRAPASTALSVLLDDVLSYVVQLSRPHTIHGLQMPGWYVPHHPAPGVGTPAGHVNNTMPDGAAGLLAFLALCTHAGHHVEGQHEAIASLLSWFALTRQDGPDGAWWPAWVSPDQIPDLHAGRPLDAVVPPPSWSGLAGMARAVQMGADTARNREAVGVAESVIAGCLTSRQMSQLTEPGLRDGLAGLYQVGRRAAAGSMTLTHRTAAVGDVLRDLVAMHDAGAAPGIGDGLLTGATGLRLAAQTMRRVNGPTSVWDSCLLIA